MDLLAAVLIFGAGFVSGILNSIAGAGSIVTFPTLIALGYPPIVANVSNAIGIVPASITGAYGYRRELRGHWRSVLAMTGWSAVGGAVGAALLLVLSPEIFEAIVPILLVAAAVLAAVQPRVARFVQRNSLGSDGALETRPVTSGVIIGVFLTGIYGGYFGAAQGVILIALLGVLWSPHLNRAVGAKNVLAGTANLISAVIFCFSGMADWWVVLIIGISSGIGGMVGSRIGRSIPAGYLRIGLVVVSLVAAVYIALN